MEKSIFTREYGIFTQRLRAARERAGLTQIQLSKKLGITQSYLSKIERGERRLDLLQVRCWSLAMGIGFPGFVEELEGQLAVKRKKC